MTAPPRVRNIESTASPSFPGVTSLAVARDYATVVTLTAYAVDGSQAMLTLDVELARRLGVVLIEEASQSRTPLYAGSLEDHRRTTEPVDELPF